MNTRARRTDPALRHTQIVAAALEAAEASHYMQVTRGEVANRAGVSISLISHSLGDVEAMRNKIMAAAVSRRVVAVVAQGLLDKHPAALEADAALRKQAAALFKK